MPKRYQGNSGRYVWVPSSGAPKEAPPPPPLRPPGEFFPPPHAPPRPGGLPGFSLLPKLLGELETEDLILLLLCYLFYRESGDSDWLIVLGALLLS
ncbi:MAG: hypothetical protein IKI69_00605 [Oscillospiraceae bacterium]|nr:hypothetical protein [Oscillospiraceae bacterium]